MKKGYFASHLTVLIVLLAKPFYGFEFDLIENGFGHLLTSRISLVLVFTGLAGTILAQVQSGPDLKVKKLEIHDKDLDHVFKRHERVSYDVRSFYSQVQDPDFDYEIDWQIGSYRLKGTLFPHDVRSEGYSLTLITDQGVVNMEKGPNTTFRGFSAQGGEIRLTITEEGISGFFTDEHHDEIYIQSSRDFISTPQPFLVIYREEDVLSDPGQRCGSTQRHAISRVRKPVQGHEQNSRSSTCAEAQVAIAADYEMYLKFNSNASELQSYLLNLKNLQESSYDFYPIEFQVVKMVIATSNGSDPWTNSEEANDLLDDFCCWAGVGSSQQLSCDGGNGFATTHDLGELWTGREFSGSTVGVAWIGTVCHSMFRYSVNQFLPTVDENRVLIAHEQGHNFGAGHVTGEYIMSSYVDPDATDFTSGNQDIIAEEVSSVSCLATCTASNSNCPGTETVNNETAAGNHQAGNLINTDGTISLSSDAMYDAPTVEITSPFTVGAGKTFEIRTNGCN